MKARLKESATLYSGDRNKVFVFLSSYNRANVAKFYAKELLSGKGLVSQFVSVPPNVLNQYYYTIVCVICKMRVRGLRN